MVSVVKTAKQKSQGHVTLITEYRMFNSRNLYVTRGLTDSRILTKLIKMTIKGLPTTKLTIKSRKLEW